MSDSREDAKLGFEVLETELRQVRDAHALLQAAFQKLQADYQKLQTENVDLRQALARSEREHKRPAAPFSKNKPTKERKKNGRKSGKQHGTHAHRPLPDPEAVDESLQAPLPCQCPHCGGQEFKDLASADQYQEEIPRRPLIRKITIHSGTCSSCGHRVQGRHPLQTSNATGACGSQLGPLTQAAIVYLNKHAGMSYRKISQAFQNLHGIRVSPGGCAQVVLRAADRLEPALIEIHEKILASKHITPDETGWRLGGRPVWLHAWVGDDGATCYSIDPKRSADALERLIGINWSGTMTHDGFSSYDRFEEACHQQCVDHALRRARGLVDKNPDKPEFPQRVIDIFMSALELRDRCRAGLITERTLSDAHEAHVAMLLDETEKRQATEEYRTFANHLHNHAEQWFLFMNEPSIPATNHLGEQALRTPITNRKVFGGNQETTGARAQETTSSVLHTCKNRAIEFVGFVADAFCGCVASLFV
jgi:transposase